MRIVPALALALILAPGCKKAGKPESGDDLAVRTVQPASAEVPRQVIDDLLANFRKVHFDLDSATLGAEALQILDANARLLVDHPAIVVEIEGHADERGTFDYNLALGESRAHAVRKALLGMGVLASRVRTTTYGEERPAADGHDEIAWAQNRRAEFRVRVADGAQ